MLAAFHNAARSFINSSPSCSYRYAAKALSTTSSSLPKRDWNVGAHPAPPTLIKNTPREEPIDLSEEPEADEYDENGKPIRTPSFRRKPSKQPTPHEFRAQRLTLKAAFPEGWSPPRKLSREAMDGLRAMHMYDPETFSTPVLAEKFKISPEAVRRILKSKWQPSREQRARFAERERRTREERIQASRLEERMKMKDVQAQLAAELGRPWRHGGSGTRTPFRRERRDKDDEERPSRSRNPGRTVGINSKDRLTFE
ncbi:hypothetical protein PLICRDRAFT_46142 [Plicaturopsis crispa FD-325 SS-3]|uniref:Required for respiratory growth protein 9, mitochondrial n=1 Tax=Plicaturopsis crispa FD-325 SS-3 TaxID=944288 RepID=A0A0C9SKT3_PLICR|nr:hypothetical protein PLICRDRAFT_46142 [Plicaturopsis crispa FD-325 SS-3]